MYFFFANRITTIVGHANRLEDMVATEKPHDGARAKAGSGAFGRITRQTQGRASRGGKCCDSQGRGDAE